MLVLFLPPLSAKETVLCCVGKTLSHTFPSTLLQKDYSPFFYLKISA